jgi:hypothetical protein
VSARAENAPRYGWHAMVEMLDICLLHPKSRRPRNRSELFAPFFGMIRNRSTTIPSRRAERNSEIDRPIFPHFSGVVMRAS